MIPLLARQSPTYAYKKKAQLPFHRYPTLLSIHYLFELINLFEVYIIDLGIRAIPAGPPLAALIIFLPVL
jgi:peptidyl-tRNA hydrolase